MSFDNQQVTRIPTSFDKEPEFLKLWGLNLSLRQFITIMFTFASYVTVAYVTADTFGLSLIFTMFIWSWIVVAGLALALIPKDGRPLEEYLTHRLTFALSNKTFIQRDPYADEVQDAKFIELREDEPRRLHEDEGLSLPWRRRK